MGSSRPGKTTSSKWTASANRRPFFSRSGGPPKTGCGRPSSLNGARPGRLDRQLAPGFGLAERGRLALGDCVALGGRAFRARSDGLVARALRAVRMAAAGRSAGRLIRPDTHPHRVLPPPAENLWPAAAWSARPARRRASLCNSRCRSWPRARAATTWARSVSPWSMPITASASAAARAGQGPQPGGGAQRWRNCVESFSRRGEGQGEGVRRVATHDGSGGFQPAVPVYATENNVRHRNGEAPRARKSKIVGPPLGVAQQAARFPIFSIQPAALPPAFVASCWSAIPGFSNSRVVPCDGQLLSGCVFSKSAGGVGIAGPDQRHRGISAGRISRLFPGSPLPPGEGRGRAFVA